jgi:hypothetical protein
MNTNDLSKYETNEFLAVLQHDTLLERFAYRRENRTGGNRREFMQMKGAKGQVEMDHEAVQLPNDVIGFKCLNYSVTESNGNVEIIVIKKVTSEITFGYRTIDDTAKAPKDYA